MTDQKTEEEKKPSLPQRLGEFAGGATKALIDGVEWTALPGAVRAVSRFVTGVGDMGHAYAKVGQAHAGLLQQRVDQQALMEADKFLAARASAVGIDPQVAIRSEERRLAEGAAEQENREAIGAETLLLIAENPPDKNTPEVEADWLNMFSSHAKKASSVRLRKQFASILAGEIRKPGSFSFATLQLMSVMDQTLAEQISQLKAHAVYNVIFMTPRYEKGDDYTRLLDLQAAGVVSLGHTKYYPPTKPIVQNDVQHEGFAHYPVGGAFIYVRFEKEMALRAALITKVGTEVLSLLPNDIDDDFVGEAVEMLRANGAAYVGREPPLLEPI
jgi:hypothetical protein